MSVFKNTKDLFEKQLDEVLSKKKSTDIDIILKAVCLILYQNQNNTDMLDLYNVLDNDIQIFSKIINLFSNRIIKFANSQEIKETILLALFYYYKEIKKLSWEDIKKIVPFEVNSIAYGIRIKNFNIFLNQELKKILSELDNA